jgi:carbohydrate-binding DOMON domain-containing protein
MDGPYKRGFISASSSRFSRELAAMPVMAALYPGRVVADWRGERALQPASLADAGCAGCIVFAALSVFLSAARAQESIGHELRRSSDPVAIF